MGKKKDPLSKAEEVGQQVFEVVTSGLTDIVTRLQELAETIEEKVEEQFRTVVGTPPPTSKAGKARDVVDAEAIETDKTDKTDKASKSKKSGKAAKSSKTAKVSKTKSSAKSSKPAKSAKSAKSTKAATTNKKSASKKSASKKSGSKSSGASSGPTRDELYEQARILEIPGRSGMTKAQLQEAVTNASK